MMTEPDPSIPPVDLSYLKQYTDGDPEAMEEIIALFYESFTEGLSGLQNNMATANKQAWVEAAHKLKGASGYMGAEYLKSICAEAQEMKVQTPEACSHIYKKIEEQYEVVCRFLKENQAQQQHI